MASGADLVSVLVPVFNHDRYVGATLDSLIAQTYPNLELVAIDDGSADRSFAVMQDAKPRCEKRFARTVLMTQANAGVGATLNRAIASAAGDYVFMCASDDLTEPEAIETLMRELQADPGVGLACGDCTYIDSQGTPISVKRGGKAFRSFVRLHLADRDGFDLDRDFGTYRSFLDGNYLPSGPLIRRNLLLQVGCYDPTYALEDYDLWLKLAKVCRFRFVDQVLAHYRIHHANAVLQMKDRLIYDNIRLAVREAEHCFAHGLGDAWRKWAMTNLDNYRKVRTPRRSRQWLGRARDKLRRWKHRLGHRLSRHTPKPSRP